MSLHTKRIAARLAEFGYRLEPNEFGFTVYSPSGERIWQTKSISSLWAMIRVLEVERLG